MQMTALPDGATLVQWIHLHMPNVQKALTHEPRDTVPTGAAAIIF